MTRTKLDTPAFADQSVNSRNIADGTIQAQDVAPGGISADKLPDTLDLSSKTVTLPNTSVANAKLANSSISVNGSSLSLGGSTSVTVFLDWQAVVVADGSTTLNAVAGRGYFLDTNTGVIEVFLPSSPSRGDTIALVDYSGTFSTNRLIINTGGVSIDSSITDGSTAGNEYQVTESNAIVELVYVDAAKGWQVMLNKAAGVTPSSVLTDGVYDSDIGFTQATGGTITTSGDYKIHTFTGDGTFNVSFAGNSPAFPGNPLAGPNTVSYLVLAGGGGSQNGNAANGAAAGGGGGGFREGRDIAPSYTASPLVNSSGLTITTTSYPVTVGGGGASGGGDQPNTSNNGSNSVFSTITSAGGGTGASYFRTGGPGGSGGGGSSGGHAGGSGNTPPVSPSQGNNGGSGFPSAWAAGGGGGAGGAGGNASGPPVKGGNAGAGVTTHISGSPVGYAGGGNGRGDSGCGSSQTPFGAASPSAAAAANRGGGGVRANGSGKGVVIIRYKYQ